MRSRIWLAAFAVVLLFTLTGCGDGAAEDRDVITAAAEKLSDAGTYQSEMEMLLYVDAAGPALEEEFEGLSGVMPVELTFSASMDNDNSDLEKTKGRIYGISVDGTRDILMAIMEEQGEPAAAGHILDGMMKQMLKDVEMLVYEEDVYYYFGDQWYELSVDDMADLPDSGMDQDQLDCLMDMSGSSIDFEEFARLSGEAINDIREEGGEEVDGVGTTRYSASLDPEGMRSYFDESMGAYFDQMERCGLDEGMPADEVDQMMEDIGEMMDTLAGAIKMEYWIDEEGYPRRQRFVIELGEEDVAEMLSVIDDAPNDDFEEQLTSLDLRMEITITNSRFGDDMEIERPEDAVPFTKLFEDLEEALGGGAGTDAWNS